MKTSLDNTIEFDSSNCSTVIGPLAHGFYFTKPVFNKLREERPETLLIIRPNLLVSLGWKHLQAVKIKENTYKVEVYEPKAAL